MIALAGFFIGAGLYFGLCDLGVYIHNGMLTAVKEWKSLKGFKDDR
jgi:hypothetical protein